jgi:prepilin-type N-terminal cleavage/methylation domain-containing protein
MKPMKTISENTVGKFELPRRRAFTLVELLVVISIIAVIAGFVIVGMKPILRTRKISVVKGEIQVIQTALENYHAKYGVYPPGNQNLNSIYTPQNDRAQLSQLYYELAGTTATAIAGVNYFVTLDGSSKIKVAEVSTAYGTGGFLNCTKGSGEDSAAAKSFLPSLSAKQLNYKVTNNTVGTTMIITSVGGPDETYKPLAAVDLNPFRYVCPGTNNPGTYDLWVQLSINGKKYLVCNWSKAVQVNTPFP